MPNDHIQRVGVADPLELLVSRCYGVNEMNVKINGKLTAIGRDAHFTDATTSSQDRLAGDEMAGEIGDLYIDQRTQSPEDQWTQVMKALRVHGFKISFGG